MSWVMLPKIEAMYCDTKNKLAKKYEMISKRMGHIINEKKWIYKIDDLWGKPEDPSHLQEEMNTLYDGKDNQTISK